jgi:hypothetical protein
MTKIFRKSKRQRARRAAWIILGDSNGGARLTAARNLEDLPDRFCLIANDTLAHNCPVIWRRGRFLGVVFISR